ncbi:MAG TPA: thioesterase family protein [Cellvibrionaceae bacterium]
MTNAQVAVDIIVPFYDVDSMDIVWHGHYIKYFEDARCRLLDAAGYNYLAMRDSGYGFPVVDIRVKYVRPASFNRRIRVVATLEEYEVRLKIGYRITDIESGEVLTKGHSIQVAVDMAKGEMCFALPDIAREKLAKLVRQS